MRGVRFPKKRPGPSGGPWRGPSPQTISDYATAETGSAGRQGKRSIDLLNIQRKVLPLYCPPMNATWLRRSPLRTGIHAAAGRPRPVHPSLAALYVARRSPTRSHRYRLSSKPTRPVHLRPAPASPARSCGASRRRVSAFAGSRGCAIPTASSRHTRCG